MRLDHLLLGSKNCSEEAIEEIAEEDEEVSKSKRKEVLRLISFLFVFNKRVLSLAGRRPRAREALFFEEATEKLRGAGNRRSKKLCAGTGV